MSVKLQAVVAILGCVQAASAQPAGVPPQLGSFVSAASVAVDSLRRGCLALGDEILVVPEVGACKALGVTTIGIAAGRRWFSGLFVRRWLVPRPDASVPDTVEERELVLLAAEAGARGMAGNIRLAPVWHYRFLQEVLRSVTVEVVPGGADGALVAIDECLNGTGGCSETFFAYRSGRWRDVRAAFLDSLDRRYPGALRHGFHVDLQSLRGSAPLYSGGDANCCASRVAEMQLRLRRDSLLIVGLKVRKLHP